LNVFYTLSFILSLSLLSISISLLPYLYMSRLRSLDLKTKKKMEEILLPGPAHYTPVHSTRVHRRGDPAGAQCTGTHGGAGHTH
jgi:hypothetical protein